MSKPRFTGLLNMLKNSSFLTKDAEADFDDFGQLSSEAQVQLQIDLQNYFNNHFGVDRVNIVVNVDEQLFDKNVGYDKTLTNASYVFNGNHNVFLTLAQLGHIEHEFDDFDADFDEDILPITFKDLGPAHKKVYEVVIHELLHMQQFLKFAHGKPTMEKWSKWKKDYSDNDVANSGPEYFFYDKEASELETFSIQIANELASALGIKQALKLLPGRRSKTSPNIDNLIQHSASLRNMKRENADFSRPEFFEMMKRAREYIKRMR